ncbi:MAG: ATP-binding protein [Jatrophihabitans sp.]|uniref:PAS domain-containing sensor histidine kinase n=1 Tax=Jatrophihabitans sp. TaxID=1932789 RepID=UPI003F8203CF
MTRQRGLWLLTTAGTAMLTLSLGWLGAEYLLDPALGASALWPAAAAALAAFVLVPRPLRTAVLVGVVPGVTIANLLAGTAAVTTPAYGVANALEVGVGGLLLVRLTALGDGRHLLRRGYRDLAALMLALAAAVVAGALALAAGLVEVGRPHVLLAARGYALAHLVGALALGPLLLVLPRTRAAWRAVARQRRLNLQWALSIAGVAATTLFLFTATVDDAFAPLLLVPLLAAAALLTPMRALTTLLVACVVATVATVRGHGPLAGIGDAALRTQALQGLLAGYCLLTLTVTLLADARVRATARLRAAERLAELAFADAPTGMMVSSLEPGRVGEIVAVNHALCELLHREPADLVGRHVKDLAPVDDADAADDHIAAMLAGTLTSYHRERPLLRADGRLVPTSHAINVVRPVDAAPYVISQITDLRSRIEAEQAMADALEAQVMAVAKLKELNAARVDAAARLAHDLRSPLTCVRAYQELLLTGAAGDLSDEQLQMVEIALRNADRVIALVDELVSTASLELENIDVTRLVRMPLGPVLTAALDTVQPVCTRQRQVLVRPGAGLDAIVAADGVQLERALVNVLANAAKYTPEGGQITVAVTADETGVAVAVTDTGIGIPAHQLARVGEQFFRADTAQAKGIKGTGLGLAVTRAVLAKHGGQLRVTSAPGHGSTFTLWLPPAQDGVVRPARTGGDALDMALAS